MLSTRDHTTSLQSDNFEYIGEIKHSQMIESKVKKHKTIGKLKGGSMYLLNAPKHIFQDRSIDNFVDDDNKMNENI